jgi:hypothetical protein
VAAAPLPPGAELRNGKAEAELPHSRTARRKQSFHTPERQGGLNRSRVPHRPAGVLVACSAPTRRGGFLTERTADLPACARLPSGRAGRQIRSALPAGRLSRRHEPGDPAKRDPLPLAPGAGSETPRNPAARDSWRRGTDRGVVPGGVAGGRFPWEGRL